MTETQLVMKRRGMAMKTSDILRLCAENAHIMWGKTHGAWYHGIPEYCRTFSRDGGWSSYPKDVFGLIGLMSERPVVDVITDSVAVSYLAVALGFMAQADGPASERTLLQILFWNDTHGRTADDVYQAFRTAQLLAEGDGE